MTNILDHGARGDGVTLNTQALQAALDLIDRAGGGTLRIPAGTFLTGTLRLPSRLTVHLDEGATLLASPDLADYPPQPFHHDEWGPTTSLLFAMGRHDIRFEGRGTIDLNDDAFMDRTAIKTGDFFSPEIAARLTPAQAAQTTCVPRARPVQPIFFHDCRGLSVQDITLRRSPCWSLTMSACEGIEITGLRIRNHLRTPNADGIHLCGCRHAVITGGDFICGDDCIALTGITDWNRACEDIRVSDCVLQSASAAVRLGHLRSKVRDVTLTNLQIVDSNRGFALFAGEGGAVERVSASGIRMRTRITAGHWWGAGEPLVLCAADAPGASIRDIRFEQVEAESEQGIVAFGTGGNLADITLRDWSQTLSFGPNRPLLGQWVDLRPAALRPAPPAGRIPWLLADQIGRFTAERVRIRTTGTINSEALVSGAQPPELSDMVSLPAD
jgi:polygalacturonase